MYEKIAKMEDLLSLLYWDDVIHFSIDQSMPYRRLVLIYTIPQVSIDQSIPYRRLVLINLYHTAG